MNTSTIGRPGAEWARAAAVASATRLLFFLKGTAPPEVRMEAIYRGVAPFVALQVLGLLVVVALPALALWLPVRLYGIP